MAYSTDKENSGLVYGYVIGHKPYAICSFLRARDERRFTQFVHREVGSIVSLTVRPNPDIVPNVSSTADGS